MPPGYRHAGRLVQFDAAGRLHTIISDHRITEYIRKIWGRYDEPYPAPYQRPFAHLGSRRRSSLPIPAFASGCSHGLLIITVGEAFREAVAELLVSHKLSQQLRLQDFYRVNWPDFQGSP